MDGAIGLERMRLGGAGGVETSLAAEPDIAALAGAALAELAEDLGAEVGALWGAGEEGGPLALLAVRGLAADAVPAVVVPGEGLGGRAVRGYGVGPLRRGGPLRGGARRAGGAGRRGRRRRVLGAGRHRWTGRAG